jgi:hypothetical protein
MGEAPERTAREMRRVGRMVPLRHQVVGSQEFVDLREEVVRAAVPFGAPSDGPVCVSTQEGLSNTLFGVKRLSALSSKFFVCRSDLP